MKNQYEHKLMFDNVNDIFEHKYLYNIEQVKRNFRKLAYFNIAYTTS